MLVWVATLNPQWRVCLTWSAVRLAYEPRFATAVVA